MHSLNGARRSPLEGSDQRIRPLARKEIRSIFGKCTDHFKEFVIQRYLSKIQSGRWGWSIRCVLGPEHDFFELFSYGFGGELTPGPLGSKKQPKREARCFPGLLRKRRVALSNDVDLSTFLGVGSPPDNKTPLLLRRGNR